MDLVHSTGTAVSRSRGDVGVVPPQLEGAVRLASRVLGGACELGWLDPSGQPSWLRAGGTGDPAGSEWAWLALGEPAMPANVVPLRARDGRLLGGISTDAEEVPAPLAALAPDLAEILAATLADHEAFAAHSALIELSSQLHADELNTDEILRLIVERARQLIGVDVTWLGLVDEHDRVAIQVAAGARSPGFADMWIAVGQGVGGLAVQEARTLVVTDHRLFEHASSDLVIETMHTEGIVSVLCAPLIFDGRPIGALYGGSRELTSFDETTVAVFTALATQAAASIVNSRLYGALSDKNELLERTLALHRRLNDAALAGADTHAIAGEVARLIERPVIVVLETGKPAAWRYGTTPDSQAPEPVDIQVGACRGEVAIRAGEERLGYIGALGDEQVSDFDRNALEQGATIMALELIRERAAWEVEWRLHGELLEEILHRTGELSEGLQARASRFGVDLLSHWTLAILEPTPSSSGDIEPAVRTALRSKTREGHALVARRGDRILIALDDAAGPAVEIVKQVLTSAERAGSAAIAGVSAAHQELPVALREAEAVLRVARDAGSTNLVTVAALGPLRHFLNTPGTAEMRTLVEDTLGAIATQDRRRKGDLMRTLRAYLRSGGHHPTAAAECHIHPSTLKYRMARVAELLEHPVTDPQARFELMLAFSTLDALVSLGLTEEEIFPAPASSAT